MMNLQAIDDEPAGDTKLNGTDFMGTPEYMPPEASVRVRARVEVRVQAKVRVSASVGMHLMVEDSVRFSVGVQLQASTEAGRDGTNAEILHIHSHTLWIFFMLFHVLHSRSNSW